MVCPLLSSYLSLLLEKEIQGDLKTGMMPRKKRGRIEEEEIGTVEDPGEREDEDNEDSSSSPLLLSGNRDARRLKGRRDAKKETDVMPRRKRGRIEKEKDTHVRGAWDEGEDEDTSPLFTSPSSSKNRNTRIILRES